MDTYKTAKHPDAMGGGNLSTWCWKKHQLGEALEQYLKRAEDTIEDTASLPPQQLSSLHSS